MKIRDMLLDQVSRIDEECDLTQKYLDECNQSFMAQLIYGESLRQLRTQMLKKRALGGVLEIVANLLPKK